MRTYGKKLGKKIVKKQELAGSPSCSHSTLPTSSSSSLSTSTSNTVNIKPKTLFVDKKNNEKDKIQDQKNDKQQNKKDTAKSEDDVFSFFSDEEKEEEAKETTTSDSQKKQNMKPKKLPSSLIKKLTKPDRKSKKKNKKKKKKKRKRVWNDPFGFGIDESDSDSDDSSSSSLSSSSSSMEDHLENDKTENSDRVTVPKANNNTVPALPIIRNRDGSQRISPSHHRGQSANRVHAATASNSSSQNQIPLHQRSSPSMTGKLSLSSTEQILSPQDTLGSMEAMTDVSQNSLDDHISDMDMSMTSQEDSQLSTSNQDGKPARKRRRRRRKNNKSPVVGSSSLEGLEVIKFGWDNSSDHEETSPAKNNGDKSDGGNNDNGGDIGEGDDDDDGFPLFTKPKRTPAKKKKQNHYIVDKESDRYKIESAIKGMKHKRTSCHRLIRLIQKIKDLHQDETEFSLTLRAHDLLVPIIDVLSAINEKHDHEILFWQSISLLVKIANDPKNAEFVPPTTFNLMEKVIRKHFSFIYSSQDSSQRSKRTPKRKASKSYLFSSPESSPSSLASPASSASSSPSLSPSLSSPSIDNNHNMATFNESDKLYLVSTSLSALCHTAERSASARDQIEGRLLTTIEHLLVNITVLFESGQYGDVGEEHMMFDIQQCLRVVDILTHRDAAESSLPFEWDTLIPILNRLLKICIDKKIEFKNIFILSNNNNSNNNTKNNNLNNNNNTTDNQQQQQQQQQRRPYEWHPSGDVALECAMWILRVFTNITHHNTDMCLRVGREQTIGVACSMLPRLLDDTALRNDDSAQVFDATAYCLGLLINLVEGVNSNREMLRNIEIEIPDVKSYKAISFFVERFVSLYETEKSKEENIIGSYLAILLGCLTRNNIKNKKTIQRQLPDKNFDTLITALKSFVLFQSKAGILTKHAFGSIQEVIDDLTDNSKDKE